MTVSHLSLACAGALALAALVNAPHSAHAAEIVVNTTIDGAGDDGLCSLREAVTAANTGLPSGASAGECAAGDPPPEVDVIRLPAGRFRLVAGAPGDDANAGGDLDVAASVAFEGAGATRTVIESAMGEPHVAGDGDRLVHLVTPALSVSFRGLALSGGDVGCDGAFCSAAGSAVLARGAASLRFEECAVRRNAASCRGVQCGSGDGAAIDASGADALEIRRSRIEQNRASCEDAGCAVGAAALAFGSLEGKGSGTPTGHLVIEATRIKGNASTCVGETCGARGVAALFADDAVLRDLELVRNVSVCTGAACRAEPVLALAASGPVGLERADLRRNRAFCEGVGCGVSNLVDVRSAAAPISLEEVAVRANQATCVGDLCNADDVFSATIELASSILVRAGRFERNVLSCRGEECDTDRLVDLTAFDGGELLFSESGLLGNRASCSGTRCDVDSVLNILADGGFDWVRSDAVRNTARCIGAPCDVDHVVRLVGSSAAVEGALFARNATACGGDGCDADAAVAMFTAGASTLAASRFLWNAARCTGEECSVEGAALDNDCPALSVAEVDFVGNAVSDDGGAIFNRAGGGVALAAVRLERNSAGRRGGAIFNDAETGDPGVVSLAGSVVTGNRAGVAAGGILNRGVVQSIVETPLAGNTPEPSCVDADGGDGCP